MSNNPKVVFTDFKQIEGNLGQMEIKILVHQIIHENIGWKNGSLLSPFTLPASKHGQAVRYDCFLVL